MRYYPELDDIKVSQLQPFLCSIQEERMLLAEDGMYKYIKEILYKFKIVPSKKSPTINVIGNVSIYGCEYNLKKREEVTQIPPHHAFTLINKKIYKRNEKSTTAFIVEWKDKKITDFYFESESQIDNDTLQEDILSFLLVLK